MSPKTNEHIPGLLKQCLKLKFHITLSAGQGNGLLFQNNIRCIIGRLTTYPELHRKISSINRLHRKGQAQLIEIGRASCRERVCKNVAFTGVAEYIQKKNKKIQK